MKWKSMGMLIKSAKYKELNVKKLGSQLVKSQRINSRAGM